jgi:hypothetical protein
MRFISFILLTTSLMVNANDTKIEDMNDFSLVCVPSSESSDPIFHLHFIKDSSYPTSHRVTVKQPIPSDCRPALRRKDDKKVYSDDWTRMNIFLRCDSDDFYGLEIDRVHGTLEVNYREIHRKNDTLFCEIRDLTNEEILRKTRF